MIDQLQTLEYVNILGIYISFGTRSVFHLDYGKQGPKEKILQIKTPIYYS
jgi:hypothetical protein